MGSTIVVGLGVKMVDLERFRENEMDEAEENAIDLFFKTFMLLVYGFSIMKLMQVLFG